MWTRSLLKTNAKQALKGRYWRSFFLCLILSFLNIGTAASRATVQGSLDGSSADDVWQGNGDFSFFSSGSLDEAEVLEVLGALGGIAAVVVLIVVVIAICWTAFLVNPLTVGRNRYFMENREGSTPMGTVTTVFGKSYLNVVKVVFLTKLKIALGSIIIIPGIYWAFCYWQVDYLMAENPYLTTGRAMELSKKMMEGEKWNTFVLGLSFIGWYLLCALTLGIGYYFLEPYIQATYAELYAALRAKALENGDTDGHELGGFVRH